MIMHDLATIIEIIHKPLEKEIETGCLDRVVVGGIEDYMHDWSAKALEQATGEQKGFFKELATLFDGYGKLQPLERKSTAEQALRMVAAIRDQLSSAPPAVSRNQRSGRKRRDAQGADGDRGDAEPDSPHRSPKQESTTNTKPFPIVSDAMSTPVQYVKGIGPKRSELLSAKLGISTVGDLLEHYPRYYLDRSKIKPIYQVGHSDQPETVQGVVVNQMKLQPKSRKILKVIIYDETAVATLVTFYQNDYSIRPRERFLKVGAKLVVTGRFKRSFGEIQTTDYDYEVLSDEDAELIHTGRIVPFYALKATFSHYALRRWVKAALDQFAGQIPEILPEQILQQYDLIARQTAVMNMHFPESYEMQAAARKRLAFDELLLLELGLALKKKRWETEETGISFRPKTDILQRFVSLLPFELTAAQKRVFSEIMADMESTHPMNRLLQGDVGSGKTVVAAMAMLLAIDNSYQSALMAPTEILAEQHYNTLTELLEPMGVRVVLLQGDMRKKAKDAVLEEIRTGSAQIVVGTHALIQESVEFANLGLEITDEQHRFGVMQRAELKKKGQHPDTLVMTATPIPRTLALTVYGDLNVSIIDELPPGRQEIATKWVAESQREEIYEFINQQIAQGRQAYLVYPLVEESEKLEDLKAATEMAEYFQSKVFPHLKVGLLHGRMKSDEKQDVMARFKSGEINILVSTTVVEVGVDVPNASIMLIEHAERFGLAQLHQLRGRVGRSHHKSFCLLIANPDPENEAALRRMKAMIETTDGFEIAEEDLAIRGPGEFFGTKQAGMPDLKLANLAKDGRLLEQAREEAFRIASDDPSLTKPGHQMLKRVLSSKWRENLEMISVG